MYRQESDFLEAGCLQFSHSFQKKVRRGGDSGRRLGKSGGDLGKVGGDLGKVGGDLGKVGGDLGKVGGDLGKVGGDLGRVYPCRMSLKGTSVYIMPRKSFMKDNFSSITRYG